MPKPQEDASLLPRLRDLLPEYLTVATATHRRGRARLLTVTCTLCGSSQEKFTSNILRGVGLGCRCLRGVKYGRDPRAAVLGSRYDAMVQRCRPLGTPMTKNYGDRGIRVLFDSREHFIRWALENLPHPTYQGVDVDRSENSGHYAPGNLRLISRSGNLANTRRTRAVQYMGQAVALSHLWHLVKTDHPEFPLAPRTVLRLVGEEGMNPDLVWKHRRKTPGGRPSTTSSTPDLAIVSLYRAK